MVSGDNDFMKKKMHFTLGLLGALFALHPFYPKFDAISFVYMGATIPLTYAFMSIGIFLALATYFFSAGMTEEHPSNLGQRLGNTFYALAVMTVPFYAGMWVTTLVEKYVVLHNWISDRSLHAPIITAVILLFWTTMWLVLSFLVHRYLARHDWTYKIDGLVDREMMALQRAKEMMEGHHDDLAVIQLHKAIMTRIKMLCLKAGIWYKASNPLPAALKAGLIAQNTWQDLETVLGSAEIASSTKPISHYQSEQAWTATKNFLSKTVI